MSVSIRGLAIKSAAAIGLAGGLTLGAASMASADVVIVDDGNQCTALWQNDDGSYTNWWNSDNTWVAR